MIIEEIISSQKRMNNPKEDSRFLSNDQQLSPNYSPLLIVFESIRIISSICILGNIALIYVIANTSFRHVSYGSLIITIAFFDSIRLIGSIFYYLLFANIIPMILKSIVI
jgi:hypothetical protein